MHMSSQGRIGAILVLLALAILSGPERGLSQSSQPRNAFDPAIFKAPPAEYRGHAMWNFPLSTLNESGIVSGIQEMAKLNYGGFFIEAGGGPTTGLSEAYLKMFRRPQSDKGVVSLSDEYFRFYRLALEEAPNLGPDQWKHPSRKPPAYKSQRSGLGLHASTLQTSRT